MKNLLIILMLTIFIFACKDEEVVARFEMNETYLPLHVGNEWRFKSDEVLDTNTYVSIINDYVKKGNKFYYEMNTDRLYKKGASKDNRNNIYLRTDDGLIYYCYIENKEYIYRVFKNFYQFNLDYDPDDSNPLILKSSYLEESKLFKIEIDSNPDFADTSYWEYYEKGIGMKYAIWYIGQVNLIYAKINGVENEFK